MMADPRTCPHDNSQPVEVRDHTTGGTIVVARICTACLTQLPTGWGCADCDFEQVHIRALGDPQSTTVTILGRPCQEHA